MKKHIFPAIRLTVISFLFFCGVYTLFILGIAQFAPQHGGGETLSLNGRVVGYALEGQRFTSDKYFWSRPSAVAFNAAGSGGSNKGPANPDYVKDVRARIDSFLVHNKDVNKTDIPSEMVTASGSGLDPDISRQGAYIQVARICAARKLSAETVKTLVDKNAEGPLFGLLGTEKINVLHLNMELDKVSAQP